jgi:phage gpG-like protein
MPADWLAFKFVGEKAFSEAMNRRKKKLEKRESTNKKVIVYVDKWIQDNFKEQGAKAEGSKWQDLAPSTILARQKIGKGPTPILEIDGTLKTRWKHLYDKDSAIIQSGVDYGIYHDSDKPRKKLPQRKIVPRRENVIDGIRKIYKMFLGETLK